VAEREHELRTLTDPRVRRTIDELGIALCNYDDHARHTRAAPTSAGRDAGTRS
jgi:hypothetical protein